MEGCANQEPMAAPGTVDDIIRFHNHSSNDLDVLAYPRVDGDFSTYEFYNSARLNATIEEALACLLKGGASLQVNPFETVAGIIAPSGLELIISACALSRLGYTVLILSTRLGPAAQKRIIETVKCELLFIAEGAHGTCASLKSSLDLDASYVVAPLPPRAEWTVAPREPFAQDKLAKGQHLIDKTAFIHCSSGSTGYPKPIFTPHRRYITELTTKTMRHSAFGSIPLFQASGFAGFWKAVAAQKVLVLPDATVPLTAETVMDTLRATRPNSMLAVPYTLKLLAECPDSWPLLRELKQVTFGGCPCPDEVGDKLVAEGVNLVAFMGSTEAGALATSIRPPGDPTWNYLRFLPSVKPYMHMKPIAPEIFELVLLDGLPSKRVSNSNDPPNSLHTRDLFRRHPTLDAWYYLGRQDDRITLSKGEKMLPLPLESAVMDCPLVRQALVFGDGREFPGLLVFRSERATGLDDEAYMNAVWPIVDRVNSEAESFAQISKTMVIVLEVDREFPKTDKSTIIRGQAYAMFKKEIDAAYEAWDSAADVGVKKTNVSSVQELRDHLADFCREELGLSLSNAHTSLFAGGLDSLKASQLVAHIRRGVEFDGKRVENVSISRIYRCETLDELAKDLCDPTAPDAGSRDAVHKEVASLIERFGAFDVNLSQQTRPVSAEKTLLLTGATGSLGSHILAEAICTTSGFSRIICLVRAHGSIDPAQRVLSRLKKQKLNHALAETKDKLTILSSDLAAPNLGLDLKTYDMLRQSVTDIIHAGWTVNFNLPLSAFVSTDLQGLHNLLNLSLTTPHRCTLAFTSSISVAGLSPLSRQTGTPVPEQAITNFDDCAPSGYARSKLVAEHMVLQARTNHGADAMVVRIGQLVGSFTGGLWNPDELVPLMVRSAMLTRTMPLLPEDSVRWLPVDLCALAVLEIMTSSSSSSSENESAAVFNVLSAARVSWEEEFLPALNAAGVECKGVSPKDWVLGLREYAETHNGAAEINPAVRLLEFWERIYGHEGERRAPELVFDDTQAQKASKTLAELACRQSHNVVKDGYIARFVEEWRKL